MNLPKMRFIHDCGHGWLEVERKELAKLGIEEVISYFSYQMGTLVYLEEDCDASLFLNKLFNNPYWYEDKELLKLYKTIPHKIVHNDAALRNYDAFKPYKGGK